MSSSKVDCHFFLTSSCRNGDKCPFRHSEGARSTEAVCPDYARTGQCAAADCGKRHTEAASNRTVKPPSEVACRNEEGGGTCTRAGCIFKHARPTQPSAGGGALNVGAKVFVPRPASKVAMRPLARPHANMEWTPTTASSNKPPPMPAKAGVWPQAGMQRVVGRPRGTAPTVARPQRPVAVGAFASRQPQQSAVSSPESSQGMDVDMESGDEPPTTVQSATQIQVRPMAQPKIKYPAVPTAPPPS
ncbi:hypothetical protein GGI21_005580, partial [Coemansia aciculifera]